MIISLFVVFFFIKSSTCFMIDGMVSIQIQQMYTQKQEQKIKTIDLNDFLDGFHNYRTVSYEKESIKSHPFAMKLRSHLKSRVDTCFSIQTFNPQTKSNSRKNLHTRNQQDHPYDRPPHTDLENINLDEFVHVILARQQKQQNEKAQAFIRSLNGTWFQDTNERFQCSKIFNTLGIKKSRSMVRPKSERCNPEHYRDRVDFTREFRQTGVFPSRKANIHNLKKPHKSPIITSHPIGSPSKSSEGSLKFQIVKLIKNQMEAKPTSKLSVRPLKNSHASLGATFNNEKLVESANRQAIIKGTKMLLHD